MDIATLEEIMSFAAAVEPVVAAENYGLSDYLRDVSSVAGSNRVLEAFAGGADQGLFPNGTQFTFQLLKTVHRSDKNVLFTS